MSSLKTFQANHLLRQERIQRNWRQHDLADQLGSTVLTIQRWEKGSQQPSAYFRVKLCALFGKSAEELGFTTKFAPFSRSADFSHNAVENEPGTLLEASSPSPDSPNPWCVPHPRNPCFTGREETLKDLHSRLHTKQAIPLIQAHVLCGMGGIGKTQVAVEYAYRYAPEYTAVFWLAAETAESLMGSLQQIADLLHLPEREVVEKSLIVTAIQRWLARHSGWLLIGDNVEESDVLQTILPAVQRGALLLTTRRQTLGLLAEPIELPPMNSEEGAAFLLRRARLLTMPTTATAVLPKIRPNPSPPAVVELVKLLEGLPLALDQAGAYIEETGCSVADYLQRCLSQRVQLLARRGTHSGAHPASVTTTLTLSVEQVEQTHPAAVELLRICAFLHPEAIPENLLMARASQESVIADPYQFDLALAALRTVSLVTRHLEARTLSVHRLVQAIVHDNMSDQENEIWQQRAMRLLNAVFPEVTHDAWEQCERLLPHVLACTSVIPEQVCNQELAELLRKTADYLSTRIQYRQAEPLYQRALRIQERTVGSDHLRMATTLCGLALLSREQGQYEQAELLFQQVVRIREQALGPNHPEMARPLNGLATLYTDLGKYEQAEPLYAHALRIWKQALGPEHPEVARSLNGLATLQKQQGKVEQAESLYQRALHIREQALGLEHPDVAVILNNLAEISKEREEYEQAEPLYQRALCIWEQALGSEHLLVAYPLSNMAELYRRQERYEQAERMSQRALHIWEQALGPEHFLMAYPLTNLAEIAHIQGRDEQAEMLFQRALQIREHHLVANHPETAITLTGLATLYRNQGKYDLAAKCYQRALQIREEQLGPEHMLTVVTRSNLATLDRNQEKEEEKERTMTQLW